LKWFKLSVAVLLWMIVPALARAQLEPSKHLEGYLGYRFGMVPTQIQDIAAGRLVRDVHSGLSEVVDYMTDQGRLTSPDGSVKDLPVGLCLSFYRGRLAGITIQIPEQTDLAAATRLVGALRTSLLAYYDASLVQRDDWLPDRHQAVIMLYDSANGNAFWLLWDKETVLVCSMTGELIMLDPECQDLLPEDPAN